MLTLEALTKDRKRYAENEERRQQVARAGKKYRETHPEEKKEKAAKYYTLNKGIIAERVDSYKKEHPEWLKNEYKKHNAKRRELGFIPLNEPFEGSEGHHVDMEHVVYILKELHRSIKHNVRTGKGMMEINKLCKNIVMAVI